MLPVSFEGHSNSLREGERGGKERGRSGAGSCGGGRRERKETKRKKGHARVSMETGKKGLAGRREKENVGGGKEKGK